ncbi:MAG: hypothetical protein NTW11_00150 [Candidatus Staskawiczbacteria bacterium]|nr:hypothetical protein [Candidatus Staskawiczbacteria bacterium]
MKIIKKIISATTAMLALPFLALAFTPGSEPTGTFAGQGASGFSAIFGKVLGLLWPIVGGLAAIMIVVSGIIFITANGDPEKIQTARTALIWAIIGIVVAILAWSIPAIISSIIAG